MTLFSAVISGQTITNAGGDQDIFELVAPANSRVLIHDVILGQTTEEGDAAAELLGILLMRGHTTTGSGGAAVTPVNLNPYSRVSGCTVARNNTTVAADGSPATILADAWNLQAGYVWRMSDILHGKILVKPSQRFVVRLNETPADDFTAYCTLLFEEIGKVPAS